MTAAAGLSSLHICIHKSTHTCACGHMHIHVHMYTHTHKHLGQEAVMR